MTKKRVSGAGQQYQYGAVVPKVPLNRQSSIIYDEKG